MSDSLAQVAAWLRAHGDSSTAEKIERLDAEMRKELDEQTAKRRETWELLKSETQRMDAENAELRARLAACEKLPDEWRKRFDIDSRRIDCDVCADELTDALASRAAGEK